jgi:hypothetical protein
MLIENKFANGDIINLKLVSGDEVVGELIESSTVGYTLKKPCVVITSSEGIGLVQAMFGLDPDKENLFYKDSHVITTCKTHEPMRDHYYKVTTTE